MWTWILAGGTALCAGLAWLLRNRSSAVAAADLGAFVGQLSRAIHQAGEVYGVRGLVPGTFTMIISVRGQEVPVPLQNIHRHYEAFPDQLPALVRQLLDEIEELGLERPRDHAFSDAALRLLPQICTLDWVFENGPAFGDSAIVHRELGPDLAICYVLDDPWTVVFVCQAHLRSWGRSEEEIFHLANQNLRRVSEGVVPMPEESGGPVRLRSGDGYDAARVLLLDPTKAENLLIALPERDTLYLGREEDRQSIASLMARDERTGSHPVSPGLYRLEDQRLVPVSEPDL